MFFPCHQSSGKMEMSCKKAMRKFHFLSRKISLTHTCELSAPVSRSNLLSKKCRTCSSIYVGKKESINNQITIYEECNEGAFNRGAVSLLRTFLWKVELSEAKAVACFSSVIHVPITSTATSVEIDDWTPYDSEDPDIDADSDLESDLD